VKSAQPRSGTRPRPLRLRIDGELERLTHYLFRYPAKFHPPVVRTLLESYTSEGDLVLDPFCGSGTLMVEAAVCGRDSIGIDVDPVAVLVAEAKVHRYQLPRLRKSATALMNELRAMRRTPAEYSRRMFTDLSKGKYEEEVARVQDWVPAVPNLFHWFRRYVLVDLARIRRTIDGIDVPATHKLLFWVVFASIIRGSSNADPVPVSGLEVTAYMKHREAAGRLVDPFALFEKALRRALGSCEEFTKRSRPDVQAKARLGDAARLADYVTGPVDAVLSSPPYHGAVDYYRRHQLEMFWLGATETADDRLVLLQDYIGRHNVAARHPYVADAVLEAELARRWEQRIRRVSEERANAFRHYLVAMAKFFENLAPLLRPGAPTLLIVGHSTWNKSRIPTTGLFREIAGQAFRLEDVLWYPVKNRYMSYARRNGANIDKEYALVFRRTSRQMRRNSA